MSLRGICEEAQILFTQTVLQRKWAFWNNENSCSWVYAGTARYLGELVDTDRVYLCLAGTEWDPRQKKITEVGFGRSQCDWSNQTLGVPAGRLHPAMWDLGEYTIQDLYVLCTVNMYRAGIHLTLVHNNHMCNNLLTTQLLWSRLKSHCIDSEEPRHPAPTSLLKKPSRVSSTALL